MTTNALLARQNSVLRWPLAATATTAAGAHIPVIGPHLREAPYMGVLFILLTAACLAFAAAALVQDAPLLYAASAATCTLAVVGYAATRIVAFPQLSDDVGNWLEPLGIVSITAETILITLALAALHHHHRARHNPPARSDKRRQLASNGLT
jgi:hypothetical protein